MEEAIPVGTRVRFPNGHKWAYGSVPPGTEGIVTHAPDLNNYRLYDRLYDVLVGNANITCYRIEIEAVKE